MKVSQYKTKTFVLEVLAILLAFVFLAPFYLVLTNSVKR